MNCPFCNEACEDKVELAHHLSRWCLEMARFNDIYTNRVAKRKKDDEWMIAEQKECERQKKLGLYQAGY